MISLFRNALKNLPTFLLAFALACAVWVSAVSEADPNEKRVYPFPVPLEIVGQNPGLVLTNTIPGQVSITLNAPNSIWQRLNAQGGLLTAVIDLSGMEAGVHTANVQVNIGLRPVEIVSVAPASINVTLEALATRSLPITLVSRGDPATGFRAGTPALDQSEATFSGPQSAVEKVAQIQALLELTNAREDLRQTLALQALDANGAPVNDVTLTPDRITANVAIIQRGGYRNVVVKVVTSGQVASGYRLTNISVFPPAVTVFSTNPAAVENLPGFVETQPINLDGVKDDLDIKASLNLPAGVSVVDQQAVTVQVGVAAIEGSITLSNMPVEVRGLPENLSASIAPARVDVILSGPLYLLDQLTNGQLRVLVDLANRGVGTYQVIPTVEIDISEVKVESILPGTVEVSVIAVTPTPTPTATPRPTATRRP